MSHTARLLYALLLDRTTLSQKNGWQDNEGRIYVIYPISEMSEMLQRSAVSVHNALNELDGAGLVERERRGFSTANRLFVKLPTPPPDVKISVPMEYKKLYISPKENFTDEVKETLDMTSRKLYPNYFTINNYTENQINGVSGEQPAAYGRYENIFLTESEYTKLKEEYPDRLERFLDELSCYLAANGKKYQNYAAALHRWADNDKKAAPKQGIPDYSYKEGESL